MKKYMLTSLAAILAAGCHGQVEKEGQAQVSKTDPQGSWKVTREVDENGNLIQYDSIYSWSSTDRAQNGSTLQLEEMDSLLDSLMGQHFSMGNLAFPGLMQNDSLLMGHFFGGALNDSRFGNPLLGNQAEVEEILKQMDSLQSLFLDKNRTQFLLPETENEN